MWPGEGGQYHMTYRYIICTSFKTSPQPKSNIKKEASTYYNTEFMCSCLPASCGGQPYLAPWCPCVVTLSQEGRTQTPHCNHSHYSERRAVEMEKRRSERRKARKERRKKGRSVIEHTTKCDKIPLQNKHPFQKNISEHHVIKYSRLTLAIHGGISGREELPTLYNHHSVCLGPQYCTLSKGEGGEGRGEEGRGGNKKGGKEAICISIK